jgi:serine/threonine protein kinase/Tol biopolymer transport system component
VNLGDWQNVKEIFNSALDLDPSDREVYLAAACAGDIGLRQKVEDLLSSYRSGFMEEPLVADQDTGDDLMIGSPLGRYEIIRLIGLGGMGRVYLARDNQLDRQVAIKVLNQKYGNHETSIQRFIQEAKAASALNHPNILTVHDIGKSETGHFIVMELVAGRPLSAIIATDNSVATLLSLGSQMAKALSAAHAAGITHRDIKPDNIMVRDDGYLKILDFGLARLVPGTNTGDEAGNLARQTAPGAVMGTIAYMSPEQGRGEPTGTPTDIFALGIVFYELLTGQHPFEAESPLGMLNSVNSQTPPAPSALTGGAAAPLDGLILRMLAKEARLRPTAREVDETLSELSSDLGRNIPILRRAPRDSARKDKWIKTAQRRGRRFIGKIAFTNGTAALPELDETPKLRPIIWRKSYWLMVMAIPCIAAIFGLIYLSTSGRSKFGTSAVEKIRLTTGGKASRAVITPNGNTVVYTENDELKARSLSNGDSRVLIGASASVSYISLAVSPDGNYVYFSARHDRSIVSLYRIPLAGGEQEWILNSVYGGISFSPDGKSFAFVRRYPDLNEYALLIADANGSNLRKVAVTNRPNNFDGTPSWSPDGRTILCSAINTGGGFHFEIQALDVASGALRVIPSRRWAWLGSLVWLPDSRNLLLVAQDENAVTAQLWRLDRITSEDFRMSDDSFIYEGLSGAADGHKFVAVKKMLESHLWIIDDSPVQVTSGFDKYDGVGGFAWAPDGRLIYHSRASGRDAIWIMNSDGSGSQQLTPDAGGGFSLSPDGRFLVFQKLESSSLGLSKLDLTNGDQKRLTENSTDMTPHFAPDGQTIIYSHFDEEHSLLRISSDGGTPTRLFDEYRTISSPTFSPDGEKIALAFGRTHGDRIRSGIAVLSSDGNRVLDTFDVDLSFGTIYERPTVQWSPDGRYLSHIKLEGGVSNVWKIDTADGTASPVTNFKVGRIFNFAFSPDGKRLALARGTVESDVLVLRPFN